MKSFFLGIIAIFIVSQIITVNGDGIDSCTFTSSDGRWEYNLTAFFNNYPPIVVFSDETQSI